jgi:hypothetical protein
MNPNADPDATLAAWLDEGPLELPDATRRAILVAVPMTTQTRRRRLGSWAAPGTWGAGRVAAAIAVAIVAVVGAGAVLRQPGPIVPGGSGGQPTLQPSGSAAPTAEPTGWLRLHEGTLYAGRYATAQFDPTLRFTLGSGWTAPFQEDGNEIALDRANEDFLGITRVSRVIDPATGDTVPVPDDLAGWLLRNPNFEWSGPGIAVTVGGLRGTMLEGRVDAGLVPTDTFAYPEGNMRIIGGDRMRYYVLPLEGPDLTIVVAGRRESGWVSTLAAVQVVLDSLEIEAP